LPLAAHSCRRPGSSWFACCWFSRCCVDIRLFPEPGLGKPGSHRQGPLPSASPRS
jgi:hypothetical protein